MAVMIVEWVLRSGGLVVTGNVVPEILDTVYYDGKEVTIGRKPIFILPKI
jgi:hypothetical protein